jgi:hypothetical protein
MANVNRIKSACLKLRLFSGDKCILLLISYSYEEQLQNVIVANAGCSVICNSMVHSSFKKKLTVHGTRSFTRAR